RGEVVISGVILLGEHHDVIDDLSHPATVAAGQLPAQANPGEYSVPTATAAGLTAAHANPSYCRLLAVLTCRRPGRAARATGRASYWRWPAPVLRQADLRGHGHAGPRAPGNQGKLDAGTPVPCGPRVEARWPWRGQLP